MALSDEIERQNSWWRRKKVAEGTLRRDLEPKIEEELEENIVTAVTGMRRVGKTTLLQRIIDHLSEQIDPTEILYYSFDIEKAPVKELLDTYFQEIRNTDVENSGKTYIFLDEVQKIEDWSDHVKAYHDSYENLKFIVTGSSSANIKKGGGESLVGRISLHHLGSLSFREFLRYKEIEVPQRSFGDFTVPENSRLIKSKLPEYLEMGGFPGLQDMDRSKRNERLRDIVDLSLFRDVIGIYGLERPELLEGIFKIIASNSGQMISYNKISRQLNAEYRTVKKYIESLRSSFLIKISRRFEDSKFKEYRKTPKIYVSDHSFCGLESVKEGLVAETVAYNHLDRVGDVGHYRKNKKEVDLILKDSEIKAFEVKYKDNINSKDLRGLEAFREDYENSEIFLITKNTLERDSTVEKIPLWLLLLHI